MANIFRRGLDAYKNTMNEPEDSEGLLKSAHAPSAYAPESAYAPSAPVSEKTNEAGDSKIRRVAKFLILIGTDRAASILSELDPEQVKDISREIAGI
ncbi:MAG: hypothetical protein LBH43_16460, partial [Treponema sp.]|nr:hypothetical protein [Treponema sp.]